MGIENLITKTKPKSPIAEAFRLIRTNIQFASLGSELKIIMGTSSLPGEGKSTVMLNLAIVIANAGYKVVHVDCDLRKPMVHKLVEKPNKGVTNILSTDGDFHDYLVSLDVPGLDILPAGTIPPNPSEILGSTKWQNLIDELAEEYDYVIIDAPPILPVADSNIIATKADGVIMIVASNETSKTQALETKRRLEHVGANILGVVLNKVELEAAKEYGYGHYYAED